MHCPIGSGCGSQSSNPHCGRRSFRSLLAGPMKKRVKDLIESSMKVVYENVCRSLFAKHKLLFSFLLTARVLITDKKIGRCASDKC